MVVKSERYTKEKPRENAEQNAENPRENAEQNARENVLSLNKRRIIAPVIHFAPDNPVSLVPWCRLKGRLKGRLRVDGAAEALPGCAVSLYVRNI